MTFDVQKEHVENTKAGFLEHISSSWPFKPGWEEDPDDINILILLETLGRIHWHPTREKPGPI